MRRPSVGDSIATPPDYETFTAADKARWIEDDLIGDTALDPVARPDLTMAKPWTMYSVAGNPETLERTFDRTDDVMERERPKIIHAQGATAMVELRTLPDSPFTGVLAPPEKGGALGVIRMSLAIPPSRQKAVTPGFGLKLFVDGRPSLDVLAMNHTVGQGRDFNLFSNTFTHDLRNEHEELRPPQKAMKFFFKRVSDEPRRLTIDHLASVASDGVDVVEPIVPERLVFRPHSDVRLLFRKHPGEDFRDTLGRIEVGSVLYDVLAVGAHSSGSDVVIGQLASTGRFVVSSGGDRLFFRHMIDPSNRVRPTR